MLDHLRIATRESALALWQAEHAASLLRQHHPGVEVQLLPMTTQGDRILDRPLAAIGGKGLFLKELERALLAQEADLAVHSMKDVPAEETPGLRTDIVLPRANPADALLAAPGMHLSALPKGSRVGTGSLRRQCQLRALRPDLKVADLRGNINTRIRKWQEGEYDAIILACAGLERLGMQQFISEQLSAPAWLPAPAQGTIGLQYREGDEAVRRMLAPLNHAETAVRTEAERAVAAGLEGSCHVPLAVFAQLAHQQLDVQALIGDPDGSCILHARATGSADAGKQLAEHIIENLLQQGARRFLDLS